MLRSFTALALFLMTALPFVFVMPVSAAPTPPSVDLLPLKKALAPLEASSGLRCHSTLRMTGTRAGVSVLLREDLQTLSRRPGCFRALLTQYGMTGGLQKKLVVVSNGAAVSTYRPGLRQYSVMSLAAFKQADSDIPTLGLVIGGFYLGEGRPLVEGVHSITSTNSAAILSVLGSMDVSLSCRTKAMKDHDDYVYSLTLTKQNLAYQFYVNTETGALTRVDLTGTQDGTDFSYREDILSITPQPPLSKSAFTFALPPGAGKTHTTPLNPSAVRRLP